MLVPKRHRRTYGNRYPLSTVVELGLGDRQLRHRAVQRLVAIGYIETRREGQGRLQYRLVPGWWKPKAEVVELAARRKAKL
jgi:hypothetical protein